MNIVINGDHKQRHLFDQRLYIHLYQSSPLDFVFKHRDLSSAYYDIAPDDLLC